MCKKTKLRAAQDDLAVLLKVSFWELDPSEEDIHAAKLEKAMNKVYDLQGAIRRESEVRAQAGRINAKGGYSA